MLEHKIIALHTTIFLVIYINYCFNLFLFFIETLMYTSNIFLYSLTPMKLVQTLSPLTQSM